MRPLTGIALQRKPVLGSSNVASLSPSGSWDRREGAESCIQSGGSVIREKIDIVTRRWRHKNLDSTCLRGDMKFRLSLVNRQTQYSVIKWCPPIQLPFALLQIFVRAVSQAGETDDRNRSSSDPGRQSSKPLVVHTATRSVGNSDAWSSKDCFQRRS